MIIKKNPTVLIVFIVVIGSIISSGCISDTSYDEKHKIFYYINNIQNVNNSIVVLIDSKIEFNHTFFTESPPVSVAPIKTFQLELNKGKHTLKVSFYNNILINSSEFNLSDEIHFLIFTSKNNDSIIIDMFFEDPPIK